MGTDWDKWFGHEHPPALKKVFVLECIWTDCPVDVQDEAGKIWEAMDYGNDYYYHSWDWDEDSIRYPIINSYLEKRIGMIGDPVLIHWWW